MKRTRLVSILLTAVMLLVATACGAYPASAQTNDISNVTDSAISKVAGGEDLPFAAGEDTFGRLYDERLVISYDKIYAEKKPIREVVLSTPSSTLYYLSISRRLHARLLGEWIDLRDPLATERAVLMWEDAISMRQFEELCDTLYRVHFELFPKVEVPETEQFAVKNGTYFLIVYYEDGTYLVTRLDSQTNEEKALIAYMMAFFARKM